MAGEKLRFAIPLPRDRESLEKMFVPTREMINDAVKTRLRAEKAAGKKEAFLAEPVAYQKAPENINLSTAKCVATTDWLSSWLSDIMIMLRAELVLGLAEIAKLLLAVGVREELSNFWAGCRYLGSMGLKLVLFGSLLWAFLALSQRSKERAGQKAAELFTAQELSRSDPPPRPENGRWQASRCPAPEHSCCLHCLNAITLAASLSVEPLRCRRSSVSASLNCFNCAVGVLAADGRRSWILRAVPDLNNLAAGK